MTSQTKQTWQNRNNYKQKTPPQIQCVFSHPQNPSNVHVWCFFGALIVAFHEEASSLQDAKENDGREKILS